MKEDKARRRRAGGKRTQCLSGKGPMTGLGRGGSSDVVKQSTVHAAPCGCHGCGGKENVLFTFTSR